MRRVICAAANSSAEYPFYGGKKLSLLFINESDRNQISNGMNGQYGLAIFNTFSNIYFKLHGGHMEYSSTIFGMRNKCNLIRVYGFVSVSDDAQMAIGCLCRTYDISASTLLDVS